MRNLFNSQFQSQPHPSPPPVESSPQPQPVEDEVEECVPETQPQFSKLKKRKQVARLTGDQPLRAKSQPWSKIDEEALAKAQIGTSKSPIVGNNQTGDDFWKEILSKFLMIMEQGHYWDLDSVASKWRKMHSVVNRFSGIYNNLYVNRRSEQSDEDVFKEAMSRYTDEHWVVFSHVRAWEVMRTNKKWAPVPNEVAAAKRTKTSETGSYSAGGSDARYQININDEPEFAEEEHVVREEARPPGSDKAKKVMWCGHDPIDYHSSMSTSYHSTLIHQSNPPSYMVWIMTHSLLSPTD
ncbi:glutathione S-transferase T3-like [Helianthus annuus]|uniref:glutathione S-transferase T3-like n=1 Tax=Helianthus annuus TaxID=4232 RepID=UPI000B90905F|nr:glutathione S-transferase T3-like [Helianthus annuus]